MPRPTAVRTNKQLVDELMTTQEPWVDTAIVVAFENRFEFVGEDHPDPMRRLDSLLKEGGLAIGLAGVMPTLHRNGVVLHTQVYQEYSEQSWAHDYMHTLRGIVRSHSNSGGEGSAA